MLEHAGPLPATALALGDVLGLVLAEDVLSDVDLPPHDKAMVDGYALRAADVVREGRPAELEVVEHIAAGDVPRRTVGPGQAARVMTGAPVPAGADAMVMVEHVRLVLDLQAAETASPALGSVVVEKLPVSAGQNIAARASGVARGQRVLAAGTEIRPVEIGVLAEAGRAQLLAVPRPIVAVLPTGNELVPVDQTPAAGQIRNSNGPILAAAIQRAGATPLAFEIARDDPEELRRSIGRALAAADVVLVSGGVSAGVLDLTPGVLAELGVVQVFHKVNIKPGKPLWFGVLPGEQAKLVFGLPGNPVSGLVCFEVFVRPAILRLSGWQPDQSFRRLPLAAPHSHRSDRETLHPARSIPVGGAQRLELLPWRGSGDLRSLTGATMLARLPAGEIQYAAGEEIEVWPF